jgi:hypothetical protein
VTGARLEGSVPQPAAVLRVLDAHAQRATRAAVDAAMPILREEAPGQLGAAFTGSVRKTGGGWRATIAPPRRRRYRTGTATVAKVARYVNRGTGLYREGPGPKRKITGKLGVLRPMVLPGGRRYRSVRGQHPNPFIARADQRAAGPARRALEDGARAAARELARMRNPARGGRARQPLR